MSTCHRILQEDQILHYTALAPSPVPLRADFTIHLMLNKWDWRGGGAVHAAAAVHVPGRSPS